MDASDQFLALLERLRSNDNAARDAAEQAYKDAQKAEPGQVLTALAKCLDPSRCTDTVVRTQAATLLRRACVQVGPGDTTWTRADAAVQGQIRLGLFQALEAEPSQQVRKILVSSVVVVASQSEAPWQELVPGAFVLAQSSNEFHKEAAMRLLAELMGTTYTQEMVARRQELGMLISTGLTVKGLQPAAMGLVAEMVSNLEDDTLSALQQVLPSVENALKALATTDPSAFEEALTSLIECAQEKAAFFKPRYAEWVEMMLAFATAKGVLEDGMRNLAFEWVGTIAESRAKPLAKAVPDLPRRVLETAFSFLAEVDHDDQWAGVDEDEEEDDDEGLHKSGEARVDFFLKKLGFAQCGQVFMALLQKYSESGHWQGKFAASMAIRAGVEFCSDARTLDTMAALLLQFLQDPHERVRYAAGFALGQMCHDQEPDFHSRWHAKMVPQLLVAINDPMDRVAAMAANSLEAVISDLDEAVLAEHAKQILNVFVAKLTSCSHKGVLVSIMEALGALAAGLEGSFEGHYDQLMEMLLAFVSKSDGNAKLRGKAFECISLLGFSVGRERFMPAAQRTMSAMLATPAVADDVQTECIREALERVCKILGSDFVPFLPVLLPGILSGVSMDSAISSASGEDDDEAEDEVLIPTDSGFVKVKSEQIMEILSVVNLLNVFIKETGASFFDFVQPTAEALARILGCTDTVLNIASQVRDAVYPCWADLVMSISKAVPAKGKVAQDMVIELVQRFVDKVGGDLVKADDPEDIAPMAQGIASVVKNAGAGCLQPVQVQGICDLALSETMKSFQRDEALKNANKKPEQATQVPGLVEDDDEVSAASDLDMEEVEEQEARIGLIAILGACMKASPELFIAHVLPQVRPLMEKWFAGPKSNNPGRLLGLHIAVDFGEHIGGQHAVALWPLFMEAVFDGLKSDEADERLAAAFNIVLAAQAPEFGPQFAAHAYAALGIALQSFKPKKNDEDAQRATDNVIAALIQLCLCHPHTCPDLDLCWQTIIAKLPLKVDTEEGHKVHRKLFVEVQKPNGGNLGSMARVAQVLGYLCEVYGKSENCEEELQHDMALAFAALPQTTLQALTAQLSAKQQKKMERIVGDAAAQRCS